MNDKERQKRLSKKRERKEQRRKAIRASRAAPRLVGPVVPPPRKFKIAMGTVGLEALGPMVVASWSIPLALKSILMEQGQAPPAPVSGHMLLDTGALRTCIAAHAAEQLGLKPIGSTPNHGAHGQKPSPVYRAHFSIGIADPHGQRLTVSRDFDFVPAIPEMPEAYAHLGPIETATGKPLNIIGVIGRDFLRHTRLSYDGPSGDIEVEIDVANMQVAPA